MRHERRLARTFAQSEQRRKAVFPLAAKFFLAMLQAMEHLQEYLETHKGSALARAVGISASYLSDIKKGNRVPSLRVAFAIERATNGAVPAKSWVKDEAA